ncbi:bifunctional cobalt-precorrin-7 (C(5))-methyltra nsferase/cobalt-precorrin-6B (C(15))-methyltransferase [Desulfonema ishimotonii]|uniref:Bifunctional cobalt-precorrin-7 (C(5))-methyltra nsferase/cobalt-precorrin-6B (C(15))-methyltransferase n=1 Tax=Desulfonema ishimotonii TaxID=45657 RepID=A0A401G4A5_9BACT|nr:precorrin-6y C5,15-methyltransferase (decarboxylating) subunit CbiE [Desulfonema ishimotonii]GBC64044.1 bifunctional cobalt-precorrin-7 (C(5))-methyltra nsferase/cobalt-precorrin-6B (C(15))-methyltransferase [Desulfonema ishimotonii]
MKPVSVIGLGLSPKDLTDAHLALIRQADVLVGGKRHLAFFHDVSALKRDITRDLKGAVAFIRNHMAERSVVVLASGDPLFYGIGALLIRSLGPENVRICPNISSVSAAFARIREPWQDACVLSLHGSFDRPVLLKALARSDKIALLTGPDRSPAWLAAFLLEREITDFEMCVLEQMGTETEQVAWYDLPLAAGHPFADPNVVILKRRPDARKPVPFYPGMPDHHFEHQRGLITKSEVRAVTLSKLRLCAAPHVMWDLGAGSGSVSVEAALMMQNGEVVAVEQHPDRVAQIRTNREKFGAVNLSVVEAVLPDGLGSLPRPDRVFIGGGGKNLGTIIRAAASRLSENGVIVANTVLLQNIGVAMNTLKELGFDTEITQIQVSTGNPMPWGERLAAQNPVWIISGFREEGKER